MLQNCLLYLLRHRCLMTLNNSQIYKIYKFFSKPNFNLNNTIMRKEIGLKRSTTSGESKGELRHLWLEHRLALTPSCTGLVPPTLISFHCFLITGICYLAMLREAKRKVQDGWKKFRQIKCNFSTTDRDFFNKISGFKGERFSNLKMTKFR